MLTHHSGLPSNRLKGFIFGDTRPSDYPDSFLRLPTLLADDYASSRPDTIFSYSNLAFSLLGNVVARTSRESFENRIQETIFKPLGMKDSSFVMTDENRSAIARDYFEGKVERVPYVLQPQTWDGNGTHFHGGSNQHSVQSLVSAFIASSEGKSDGLHRPSGFFVIDMKVAGSRASYPLLPLSETEAQLMGVGHNLGESLRVLSSSNGETLIFQGYVLSKD